MHYSNGFVIILLMMLKHLEQEIQDVKQEESYNRGKAVCLGYSRLYKYIGKYISIDVICVMGYAKELVLAIMMSLVIQIVNGIF